MIYSKKKTNIKINANLHIIMKSLFKKLKKNI